MYITRSLSSWCIHVLSFEKTRICMMCVRERERVYTLGKGNRGKSFSLSRCSHDADTDTDTDYDTQILQLLLL